MKNKNIPTHKVCNQCGEDKPLEEFSKNKSRKDGKQIRCKSCNKAYREEHKEEVTEYNKQYQKEHTEEIVIKKHQSYEKNKEEIAERQKQYYEEHKEQIIERQKQYYEEHKEKIAEYKKYYAQTHGGKEASRKNYANRQRDLGYIPLNERPDQSDNWRGHHVDTEHIIYIPTEMHITNFHCVRGERAGSGMDVINELAFEYLFDNLDCLRVPEEFVVELRDSLLN